MIFSEKLIDIGILLLFFHLINQVVRDLFNCLKACIIRKHVNHHLVLPVEVFENPFDVVHLFVHGHETVESLGVNLTHNRDFAVLVVGFYRILLGYLTDVGKRDVRFGVKWIILGMCFLQFFVWALLYVAELKVTEVLKLRIALFNLEEWCMGHLL